MADEETPAPEEETTAAAPEAAAAAETAAPAEGAAPEAEATPVVAAEEPKEEVRGGGDKAVSEALFAELDGSDGEDAKVKVYKSKVNKNVQVGIVHVLATFNNTIVSVTDLSGNVIGWGSAGKMGFKGSRKSTAYAAQLVSQDACRQAMGHGLKEVEIRVKGPGSGRESAVRAVQAVGLEVSLIKDVTAIPHNGCRPPKARRV